MTSMNISKQMVKRCLANEDLDRTADPYEAESYERSDEPVHHSFHLDVAGKHVTALYNAAVCQTN